RISFKGSPETLSPAGGFYREMDSHPKSDTGPLSSSGSAATSIPGATPRTFPWDPCEALLQARRPFTHGVSQGQHGACTSLLCGRGRLCRCLDRDGSRSMGDCACLCGEPSRFEVHYFLGAVSLRLEAGSSSLDAVIRWQGLRVSQQRNIRRAGLAGEES